MKKSITSGLALAAILASGVAYAIEDTEPLYPELPLISTIPADGAELPGLYDDDSISITIAEEMVEDYPDMYVTYALEEKVDGTWENLKFSWLNRLIDLDTDKYTNTYATAFVGNFDMEIGTDYRLVFTAYDSEMYGADVLGQSFVYLKGTTPAFVYSPFQFESISPEDAGTGDDNVFNEKAILTSDIPYLTVTFSGDVTLEDTGYLIGMGAGVQKFTCEPASDATTVEGKQYASEWHILIPEGFVASHNQPVMISMKAYDEEGRIVKGTEGEKSGSYFLFSYNVPGMYGEGEVSFGTEPLAIVSAVTVKNPIGVNVSWMVPFDEAKIMRNGVEVAHVVDSQLIFAPGEADQEDAVAKEVMLMLDKPVTKAGEYTFILPSGFLNYGTQFTVLYQLAMEVPFTVVESPFVEAYPEPGKVDELNTFYLHYDEDEIAINPDTTEKPYLYSAELNQRLGAWTSVEAMGNNLTLTYRTTITDPDTYTLVIPSGFLTVNGEPLAGVALEYVIEKGGDETEYPAVFTPASGNLEVLPTQIDFVFPNNQVWGAGSGVATIKFNDNDPEKLPDPLFDWDAPANEGWQPLGDFAGMAIEGTCTISFPAGYFIIDEKDAPAMEVVYTNGGGNDYAAEFTPAPGALTVLPDRIEYRFPNEEVVDLGYGEPATIRFNDEEPVELSYAFYDDDDAYNEGYQPLDSFAGATEKGTYTITFPAGYFQFGTYTSPETTFSEEMVLVYTIGEVDPGTDYPAIFDPAPGVITQFLESLYITFPDAKEVGGGNGRAEMQINDDDPVILPDATYGEGLNEMVQPFGAFAYLALPGTYTLKFPAGYFVVDESDSPEMILVYTIEGGTTGGEVLDNLEIKWTPAPGVVTGLPEELAFKLIDHSEWTCNYDNPIYATLQYNDEAPVDLPLADLDWNNINDWTLGVQPLGEYANATAPGTYTLTFPEGYFIIDETMDLSPEMVIVYTIEGGVEPVQITVEPADGAELTALPALITLTFPSEWIEGESLIDPTLQFNDNEPVDLPEFEKDYGINYLLYQQSLGQFAGATEEGTYVIRFPEDFFRIGSWSNYDASVPVPAMAITYHIGDGTGVTLVGIEADIYHVYDLNGVKVLETTNAEDLKALKGLYIVNGVKMLFNK